jgi:hypothetical protein
MTREERVLRLVRAAGEGMLTEAKHTSLEDVLSATLTLANRTLQIAMDKGADPAALRVLIQQLLLTCADRRVM